MKVLSQEMSTKCKSLKEKVPEVQCGILDMEAIQGEGIQWGFWGKQTETLYVTDVCGYCSQLCMLALICTFPSFADKYTKHLV